MDKRKKLFNTRNIRTQLADSSYKDGLLSVPDFLNSREFEIKSFEMSQLKTRASASNRIFQSLPRTLRRRTASHNVKRVPKRLRNRALREMQDTNPVKRKPTSKQIYKLRMSKKLLKLATKIKLLKSIPIDNQAAVKDKIKQLDKQLEELRNKKHLEKPVLNNVMGSYDNTGVNEFAKKPRGNLKYSKRQKQYVWLGTHVWHAKRFHMIKRWGYQIPLAPSQKCFKSINRAARHNTIIFDTSYYDSMVMDYDEKLIRDLIKPTTLILKGTKSYQGPLYVEGIHVGDCLFYCNPHISKMILRVHPSVYEELFIHIKDTYNVNLHDCRYSLGSIELVGPTSLNTLNKIFHITKDIPEFKNLSLYNDTLPKGTIFSFNIQDPRLWKHPVKPPVKETMSYNDLIINLSKGIIENESLVQLLSPEGREQSYKDQLTTKLLDKHPDPKDVAESIPVLLTKGEYSWSLILPWFWVLPVWLKLNHIPHVHLGGVNQLKQLAFERQELSFPQDFPYLPQGWLDNELEIKLCQEKYNKLPLSKKQREKFESGMLPYGNDWEYLAKMIFILHKEGKKLENKHQFGSFDEKSIKKINTLPDMIDFIDSTRNFKLCIELFDQDKISHQNFIQGSYEVDYSNFPKLPVKMIKFNIPTGSLDENARIYSGDESDIQNLVGFVTTGGYNLNLGITSGVGYISANTPTNDLVVRNIGTSKAYKISVNS